MAALPRKEGRKTRKKGKRGDFLLEREELQTVEKRFHFQGFTKY